MEDLGPTSKLTAISGHNDVQISPFGSIWTALEEWTSAQSLAFLYGKNAPEAWIEMEGREYSQQSPTSTSQWDQIHRAFVESMGRVLADVAQACHLSVPLSMLQQSLVSLHVVPYSGSIVI